MSERLRKVLKIVSVCAACLTLLSGSASCRGQSETTSELAETENKVTFTVWAPYDPAVIDAGIETIGDYEIWQEIENIQKIHLDFHMPSEADRNQEDFNLMIASGTFPSLIMGLADYYSTGPDAAISDGVIIRLNELISEYAPNYLNKMNINDDVRKLTITDQGNIFTFAMISDQARAPWFGPVVRVDLLEKAGLDMPVTYVEWHEMLTSFKAMGVAEPFLLNSSGFPSFSVFTAGYEFVYDDKQEFYQINGSVKYAPVENGFKDYLAMMHQWYSDGLISKDFLSNGKSNNTKAKIIQGTCAAICSPSAMLQNYMNESTLEGFRLAAAPEPKVSAGDRLHIRQLNPQAATWSSFSITTQCEQPELAAAYLDYFYSDAAYLTVNYGIEGVSYELVDGKPRFTDLMTDNTQGTSFVNNLSRYTMRSGSFFQSIASEQAEMSPVQLSAEQVWGQADTGYLMPDVTLTPEEGKVFGRIMKKTRSYVNDMSVRFIIGIEPFDNYDVFVSRIESFGIVEAIAIQQSALDRFMRR